MYIAVFASPRSKTGLSTVVQSLNQWLGTETSFRVAVFHWGEREGASLVSDVIDSTHQITSEMNHFHQLQLLPEDEFEKVLQKANKTLDVILIDLPLSRKLDYLHVIESADRIFILNREAPVTTIAEELALYVQKTKKMNKHTISALRTQFTADHKVLLFEEVDEKKESLGFIKQELHESPVRISQLGEVLYAEVFRKELKEKTSQKIEEFSLGMIEEIKKVHKEDDSHLHILFEKVNEMAIPFQDKTLIYKYTLLRIHLGQPVEEAIKNILQMYQENSSNNMLVQLQQELSLSQVRFK
jgi:cellulose biosynthesis protein BcsQ